MEKLNLSKHEVYELFEKGQKIKTCCGLWNDPRTRGKEVKSKEEIYKLYDWAQVVEIKVFENDNAIYLHGYSYCDMF